MKYLFLLFLLFPLSSFAQNLTFDKEEIIEVDSASKEELFDRAVNYLNSKFGIKTTVDKALDRDAGTIYFKGIFFLSEFDQVYFDLNIACKDGKYRYVIKELYHKGHGGGYGNISRFEVEGGLLQDEKPDMRMPGKHWKKIQNYGSAQLLELSKELIISLKVPSFTDF